MRLRYLIGLALFGVLTAASPSLAAPPERPVSGPMSGGTTGVASFCTAGTIPSRGCVPSDPYPVDGTFTFSGRGGSFTAAGSGTGVTNTSAHTDDYTIDLELTIQSGTGRYRHASGSLAVELLATAFLQDGTEGANGTIDGSITIGGPA